MNAFVVETPNRPGELAQVTEVLAARGVNLLVYALPAATRWGIAFIPNKEQDARSALDDAGIAYREIPLIHVRMEDKPGQTAAASRRLADEGVNIEVWLPVDTSRDNFTVAVGISDVEAAQKALGDQLTTWSYS